MCVCVSEVSLFRHSDIYFSFFVPPHTQLGSSSHTDMMRWVGAIADVIESAPRAETPFEAAIRGIGRLNVRDVDALFASCAVSWYACLCLCVCVCVCVCVCDG